MIGRALLVLAVFAVCAISFSYIAARIGISDHNITVMLYKIVSTLLLLMYFKSLNWHQKNSKTKILGLSVYAFSATIFILTLTLMLIVVFMKLSPGEVFKQYELFSWLMLSTVVIAPITEEILFRGMIYETLKRGCAPKTAWFIQGCLFALIHINPIQMAYTLIFGWIFGWVYDKTKSLLITIWTHMIVNFLEHFFFRGCIIIWE